MTLVDDIASSQASPYLSPDSLAGIRTPAPENECVDKNFSASSLHISALKSVTWERVKTANSSDEDMHKLTELIETGFSDSRHELPKSLQEYF